MGERKSGEKEKNMQKFLGVFLWIFFFYIGNSILFSPSHTVSSSACHPSARQSWE